MGAVLARQPGAAGAVEASAVEVALARVLLGGGEVEEAAALVEDEARAGASERHAAVHHPWALGHGPAGPGEVAEVDVREAVTLGDPEEAAAVLQEARRPEGVDPGLRALGQDRSGGSERLARRCGHGQQAQVQLALGAVQVLEGDVARVGRPGELGQDVDVVGIERQEPLRARGAVLLESHDAEADDRVRGAGLGVALPLELVAYGQEIDDREAGDARLVELEVGDRLRVRRPDERLAGARGELLLVDPVELSVEQRLGAALGEPGFPAGRHVDDEEVAAADEGHPAAVGRRLGVLLGLFRPHERPDGPGAHVDREHVALCRDEQCLAVGEPRRRGQRQRPGFSPGSSSFAPSSSSVSAPLATSSANRLVVSPARAQERQPLAVGVPLETRRQGPRQGRLGVDPLDVSFSSGAASEQRGAEREAPSAHGQGETDARLGTSGLTELSHQNRPHVPTARRGTSGRG